MKPIAEGHALRRFFRGLIDNTFCAEIGICDPDLTEYIADLLVKFVHVDALYALRRADAGSSSTSTAANSSPPKRAIVSPSFCAAANLSAICLRS